MFWDKIDVVYVINLPHRKDRWDSVMEHLSEFVPASKIHRVEAILGTDIPGYGAPPWFGKRTGPARHRAGAAGAVLSHKKALEEARRMGYSNALILEDDARFNDPLTGAKGDLIARFMRSETPWDILYLGFINGRREVARVYGDADTGFIERLCGILTAHAYLVNGAAYDKLLKRLPDEGNVWSWLAFHWAIDVWLRNWFAPFNKVYRCYPCIVDQTGSFSDIEGSENWFLGAGHDWIVYKSEKRLERKIALLRITNPLYYFRKGGKRWLGARFLGYTPHKKPKRK
uniref:Glycosyltransferase involved in LPS biosynthesis, GR25 family n=1 Tax=Candidatus Kentrum sp. UNK TaxID=2126344 RepID=A0A451AXS5_9GAMM|nr:MAG: Glycosyltransferase involved in LPS biosynthesis, GR25 family [Candidatus Kentron sp. UNK]VFK70866.1 MAG: Glycosyltransferase involved in LPS biosynthesis, GR25 family [Candidatus Kentron sp. UNK]